MIAWLRQRLRSFAWWLLATVPPAAHEIDAAMKGAFADCGLPVDAYAEDFDLLHSGKFHEVLHHAAKRLGRPIVTVGDLRSLLE